MTESNAINSPKFSRGPVITPFEKECGVIKKEQCRCGKYNHVKRLEYSEGTSNAVAHCPWCGTWYNLSLPI